MVSFGFVFLLKSTLILSTAHVEKSSWLLGGLGEADSLSLAGWWIICVSAPLLLFLLLHWLWRFIIWINFIIKVSRIKLELQPAHPDEVGGLGLLTGAQLSFAWIFMAVGTMMSSTIASEVIHAGRSLADAKLEILGFVLTCFVLITVPLCTFSGQLYKTRRRGLKYYSELGHTLTKTFNSNWIDNKDKDKGEKLITAVDPSAVADYSVIYETIRGMGVFPLTRQKALRLLIMLIVPFVPLVFTQFSLREALERLAQTLI